MNGDAYPAAVSQKVTKNLPASFYSPMPGFNTCFPSFAIPHIFHTGNTSSSNELILLTNHVWSRVEVHSILPYAFALSKCILISSWLVYYDIILHVVLYHVTFILPLNNYRYVTKIANSTFRKSDIFILLERGEWFSAVLGIIYYIYYIHYIFVSQTFNTVLGIIYYIYYIHYIFVSQTFNTCSI